MTMHGAAETRVRELDRRTNDGIDVALLWNPRRSRVSVAVTDERSGESLEFEVDPADALAAFQHPYSYAGGSPRRHVPRERLDPRPTTGLGPQGALALPGDPAA
jgi:hypothetical protein